MLKVPHRVLRLSQTPRAFRNWPSIIRTLAGGHSESVFFEARSGASIWCPNIPGARVPVYEIFAEDCYRIRAFLGPLLAETIRVVDIGAHIGAFACALASEAKSAQIWCFEPSPTTAEYLRRNIAENRLGDRVVVSESAVSSDSGESVLVDNGGGSALNRLAALSTKASGVTVQTTTFDAIVGEVGRAADVVKIDCEGGEYDLVLGSSPRSWAGTRRVVLEYHPHPDHEWSELRAWFAARGLVVTHEVPENPRQGTAWLERQD